MLTIVPTFTSQFDIAFGANAVAARSAWVAAANIFSTHLLDNIHVNLIVDAVAGTGVFGESNTALVSVSYDDLRARLVADAKTANDTLAIGPGGSMVNADPTNGAGNWWVSRAQAKAISLISDDGSNDGKTTFGAGKPAVIDGCGWVFANATETFELAIHFEPM